MMGDFIDCNHTTKDSIQDSKRCYRETYLLIGFRYDDLHLMMKDRIIK